MSCKSLLAKGADVDAVDRIAEDRDDLRRRARATPTIVLLLLRSGVDANALYAHDLTALMWAAGYGKTDTVEALLAAGARPS